MADTVLAHPNRDKAESKATKAIVILLLIASAALILIVTIGGWSLLQGAQIVSFAYAAISSAWPSSSVAGTAACFRWRPRWRSCSR